MFQLTGEEAGNLRYQNGTSSWGGRRYPPQAFTEHDAQFKSVIDAIRELMTPLDPRPRRRIGFISDD